MSNSEQDDNERGKQGNLEIAKEVEVGQSAHTQTRNSNHC